MMTTWASSSRRIHITKWAQSAIVPDPTNLLDYNRYMYVRGNPLNATDPSGHETIKPNWWPAYVPFPLDLPDEASYEAVVEWASENNIPTATSTQFGYDISGGYGGHGESAGELQSTISLISGQWLLSWNNSGGVLLGTPSNGIDFYVGGSVHYNTSGLESLLDASMYSAATLQADAPVNLGANGTWARAINYGDFNGDKSFNLTGNESFAINSPALDPLSKAPVDSLSLDLAVGLDAIPNGIDAGLSGGVQDTNEVVLVDFYAPFRWAYNAVFR